MGLALFMKLTPAQRGAVILMDVLGHSLVEIAEILDTSVPAIKGAFNRGRASLRKLGRRERVAARPFGSRPARKLCPPLRRPGLR